VQEGNSLSLCADARLIVNQLDSSAAAALQGRVEIVDRKADMMDPASSPGHEPADWGGGIVCFQELHERLTGAEADNARPIGIIEVNFAQPEHIPEKRESFGDSLHGDPDVRDPRAARG
jgi:hypothetical protein